MATTQLHQHNQGQTAYRHYIKNPSRQTLFYLAGHKNPLDHHKSDLLRDICKSCGLNFIHFAYAGYDGSTYNGVPAEAEGYVQHWLSQALDFFDTCVPKPCLLAGYSMGAYLTLALANERAAQIKGIIGLSSGFGENLVQQMQDHYGALKVISFEDTSLGFNFEKLPDLSIAIKTPLNNITCPTFLNHAADDALVSPKNLQHIAAACPNAHVQATLSATGQHRLNEAENNRWLEKVLGDL
jgi:pimeloyl-ACP methyl ester carboxylesterase